MPAPVLTPLDHPIQAINDADSRTLTVQRWATSGDGALTRVASSTVLASSGEEASSLAVAPQGQWVAVAFEVSGRGSDEV